MKLNLAYTVERSCKQKYSGCLEWGALQPTSTYAKTRLW